MRGAVLCLMLTALLVLAGQAAFAASNITVTVTLQQIGVEVSPTSWALGTMAPGSFEETTGRHFTATNTGNVAEDLTITAGVSSPSGWSPVGESSALDHYDMHVTTDAVYRGHMAPDYALASDVAAGGAVGFDLYFGTPLPGSTYNPGGETITVSLSASVHP